LFKVTKDRNNNIERVPIEVESVLGLDLLSGSPKSRKKPKYSAFLIHGEKIQHFVDISLQEIKKLIAREKPAYIAVDNIFELFQNKDELVNLSRWIPESTSIIQVTGSPQHGFTSIKKLAKQFNLTRENKKLDALETAEVCARLALMNQGFKVSALEDEITVLITRTRSKGPGGWSQRRFSRRMDIAVNTAARTFIEELINNNYDFDEFLYKDRAVFKIILHDMSRMSGVKDILSKLQTGEVNTKIFREAKKLEFIPLSAKIPSRTGKSLDSLIVGIDPGTTTGIAILDLKGHIVSLTSKRNMSTMAGVKLIASHGRPVIIAADVYPVPKTVLKYKKTFGCRLVTPGKKVSKHDKKNLISEHLDNYGKKTDAHTRDALYAAIHAYKRHEDTLIKVKTEFFNNPFLKQYTGTLDDVYSSVLAGKSIHAALEEQLRKIEQVISLQPPQDDESLDDYPLQARKEIASLKKRAEKLQLENSLLQISYNRVKDDLQCALDERDRTIEEYDSFRWKRSLEIDQNKRVKSKIKRITALEREINEYKRSIKRLELRLDAATKFRNFWSRGNIIPLRVIPKFSEEAILEFNRETGFTKDDLVFFKDPSGGGSKTAKLLAEHGIAAVLLKEGQKIAQGARESLKKLKVACFTLSIFHFDPDNLIQQLPIEKTRAFIIRFEDFYCVNKKKMQILLRKFQFELERELLEERKRSRELERELLESESEEDPIITMIREYQNARRLVRQIFGENGEDENNGDFYEDDYP